MIVRILVRNSQIVNILGTSSEEGLAFQIQDDILDVTSTQEELANVGLKNRRHQC